MWKSGSGSQNFSSSVSRNRSTMPGGRADEALVRDQAALRVRGRAGRVHQERDVPHAHRVPAQLELLERDGVAAGEEGGAIEVAVG